MPKYKSWDVEYCSTIDREKSVIHIMSPSCQLMEVNQENNQLSIEIYPNDDDEPWIMDYDDLITLLEMASETLLGEKYIKH